MFRFLSLPRINDITTDLEDPPAFSAGSGRPCAGVSYPGSFAEKVRAGYPDLGPLRRDTTPEQTFTEVQRAAESMERWDIARVDAEGLTLEAVAITPLLRFRDDIVVRVRPDGTGSRVDVRSRSRLGQHDFGANADRIRAYLDRLR